MKYFYKKFLIIAFSIIFLYNTDFYGANIYNDGPTTFENIKLTEDDVIEDFKKNYINASMSDFEKEIIIIRWMVENISYDYENVALKSIPENSHTAYGALVEKVAVCDGYAEAFNKLSASVGLNTIMVKGMADRDGYSVLHAWNQINLDGEWYNVDVTFEDPKYNGSYTNPYGFNGLYNEFINVTDTELLKTHTYELVNNCTSTDYGKWTVGYYDMTGTVLKINDVETYKNLIMMNYVNKSTDKNTENLANILNVANSGRFADGRNVYMGASDLEKIKTFIASCVSFIKGDGSIGYNAIAISTHISVDVYDFLEKMMSIKNELCADNYIFDNVCLVDDDYKVWFLFKGSSKN